MMTLNDPAERACYVRVKGRLLARGVWREEYDLFLVPTVRQCASYLRFAREVRALQNATPEELRPIEEQLAVTHRLAREALARFLMIRPDRVPLATMSIDGLDAEIAALCAPLGVPRHLLPH